MTITIPSGRSLPLQAKAGSGFQSAGLVVSEDWIFQAQSYLSPLTMEVIYPRPDVETRTASFHRKAHTGLSYRVPVGVRGGCWPYRYEIISGPAGATITEELTRTTDGATGQTLHQLSSDYGVVTWDTSGETDGTSFSFTVRVTDQLGVSVDVIWSGQIDNAAFVFVDSVSGNDANAGDIANPLQTFANGLWKNSDADATYAGKIAACTGTLDINAGTLDTSPILDDAVKPVAFVANGACTFNTSRGHFRTTSQLDDPAFFGIDFDGSRTDLANNRIFNFTNSIQRPAFFECSWSNVTIGTSGTDNPACVGFYGGASPIHSYIFMSRCDIASTCDVQLIVTFDSNHVLTERNFGLSVNISPSNGAHALHLKDDTSNLTVRANTFKGTAGTAMISVSNQNNLGVDVENQEACYNTIVFEGGGVNADVDGAMVWDSASSSPDGVNTHHYRNTVITETSLAYRAVGNAVSVSGFGDAHVGSGANEFSYPGLPAPAFQELTVSDFDASHKLTGTARTNYLGSVGAELAGSA